MEETVTKVRALTLKNTLLSGDVAVTIGGKVVVAQMCYQATAVFTFTHSSPTKRFSGVLHMRAFRSVIDGTLFVRRSIAVTVDGVSKRVA